MFSAPELELPGAVGNVKINYPIEKLKGISYKHYKGKSNPLREVMPMEQFLLDILAQVLGGILVVLILRRWR